MADQDRVALPESPEWEVSIRTIAMPADTNPAGDIFGGWLMSQMDLAGGTFAYRAAGGRVVTVAVNGFTFHKPVFVGDQLTCYCREARRGRTSITIEVQAWVCRYITNEPVKVTEGLFTFVALGADRLPRELPPAPTR